MNMQPDRDHTLVGKVIHFMGSNFQFSLYFINIFMLGINSLKDVSHTVLRVTKFTEVT